MSPKHGHGVGSEPLLHLSRERDQARPRRARPAARQTMRGQSTTTPPCVPRERLTSGASWPGAAGAVSTIGAGVTGFGSSGGGAPAHDAAQGSTKAVAVRRKAISRGSSL
jgi:hypothetical protein